MKTTKNNSISIIRTLKKIRFLLKHGWLLAEQCVALMEATEKLVYALNQRFIELDHTKTYNVVVGSKEEAAWLSKCIHEVEMKTKIHFPPIIVTTHEMTEVENGNIRDYTG